MSKTSYILIGLAGGAIRIASAASSLAQPPQGQRPSVQQGGPGPQGGRGGPGGRAGGRGGDPAMRQQMLHNRLAITPAQDSAFTAWVAATRPPEGSPPQDMTTPQRLDSQLAELTARVTATKRFYAALSAEQKQTFDALPPQMTMGQPGRGGQGGPGGPGGGRRGGRGGPDGAGGPPQNGGYNPQ